MKSFKLIELGVLASVLLILGGCGTKEHGWSGKYKLEPSDSLPAYLKTPNKNMAVSPGSTLEIDEKAKTLKLMGNDLVIVSVTDTKLSAEGTGPILELLAKLGGYEDKGSKVTIYFEKDASGVYSVVKNGNRASLWKRIAGK
jgi:hypothetical protein